MAFFRSSSIAVAVLLAAGLGSAFAQNLRLSGAEETPPNNSTAVGNASIQVDADGNVTGTVSAPTLAQPRVVHIQLGAPGQSGPPIITLAGGDEGTWTVPDGAKLTPSQLLSYKAGNLYVNIHTEAYPGGELRGQLRP